MWVHLTEMCRLKFGLFIFDAEGLGPRLGWVRTRAGVGREHIQFLFIAIVLGMRGVLGGWGL